jgi:hypothetical protein
MRKLFIGFAVGAMALAGATTASAGTLTSATLSFALGTLPSATLFAGPGGGTASSSSSWNVAAGDVPTGAFTTTLPSSAAPPLTKIQVVISGNPAGAAFAASSGASMAVTGVANVKSYGGITLLGIPLTGGVTTTINAGPSYGVLVTAFANDWTTKTTVVALTTPTSQGATTAKTTGSNGLDSAGNGTVVLVSGINVLTNIAGQFAAFLILTLNYAPEPGTLLLLGSGIVGLAVIGRRKLQK